MEDGVSLPLHKQEIHTTCTYSTYSAAQYIQHDTYIQHNTHTSHHNTHNTHTLHHNISHHTHHITHITSHHVRTNLIPLIPYECTSCSTAADIVAIAAGSVIPADTYIVNVCMYVRTVRNNLLIIISVQ